MGTCPKGLNDSEVNFFIGSLMALLVEAVASVEAADIILTAAICLRGSWIKSGRLAFPKSGG